MTVNHGVPGSSPGEGAKGKQKFSLFCFMKQPAVCIRYSNKLGKFFIGKSENFIQRFTIYNSDENEKWSKTASLWSEYLIIECLNFN